MLLKKLQDSPAKAVPVAMTLLITGLMLLTADTMWQHLGFTAVHVGPLGADFFRGFIYGAAIMFEIAALIILVKCMPARSSKA